MNVSQYEAQIRGFDAMPAVLVRERVYGAVRVTAEWSDERVMLRVAGDVDRRDAPAFVELFFHDVFLLLNLAMPGSFAGTIATSDGDLAVRELTFRADVFAPANQERLPLENVAEWYEALGIGTQQVAATPEGIALFELLHLARNGEDDERSILSLARAAEALLGRPDSLRRLFELREAIAFGRLPLFHPMHDEALDPRVEDATAELIEVADAAARVVIGALQEKVKAAASARLTIPANSILVVARDSGE